MEVKELRNSRDDQIHAFRSFGSNYLPSSQSQKISIGVMAEETEKKNSGAKNDGAALKTAEKEASCQNLVEEDFKRISMKSLHQPTETVQFHAKEPPVLQSNNIANKRSNRVKQTPIKKTVQFDANRTSAQKNINNINSRRRRKKARNTGKVEELAVAAVQESDELNKGEQEEKAAHQSNNALRMKLSEILGSAPSPTKKSLSFETPHIGVKDLKLEGHFHQKSIKVANDRLNSHTIETDSPSPSETIRRPVTRSLTRKKAPTKSVQKINYTSENLALSPVSGTGQKRRNIFSFSEAELWSRTLHVATNISNSSFIFKNGEKNCGKVEQKKTCVSHMITPHKSQRTTDKGKTSSPAQKIAPHSRTESFLGHSRQDDTEKLQSMNGVMQEIHHSPARKKRFQEIHHSPARKKRFQEEDCQSPLPREAGAQEDSHRFSSKKNEDPQFDVESQTLGTKISINPSPSSPDPKSKQTEQGAHSPAAAERRPMEKVFSSSRTLWTSKAGSFRFDIETEFSDDFETPKAPSIRKLSPDKEEKESRGRTSQSSSEQDADSFEDPAIKKGATSTWTPESDDCETSSFLLHPSKRRHGQGGIRINELSSSLPYLKEFAGTQESNGLEGPSDGNHEDCLARAVALFTSALERVRTKMKSLMTQRCTELLASVAEETQLQLQNVESHIARDIEKLTSLEESKRKSLEKKFQEKQERLNLIYEKFKEDMNKHLEDCRSTLEGLEIYQREQKGNAGKLKSLHRKLLLQAEEGIGSQLSDAERRITNVQKAARQKMFQLRHVIRELLREGDCGG